MKEYNNILVNALVNLGDVVLTTGAVALLKRAWPEARVTMLVKPACRQAVENNPVIDEVIVFGYKPGENSFGLMRKMVQELKKRHFDLSISFDRKLRPALLAWLAHIPARIGPDRVFDDKPSRVTWLYTETVHITHDLDGTLQAETYQAIVRGVTGQSPEEKAESVFARVTPEAEEKAEALLARLPAGCHIGLCVKGTFPLKTWPKEYFAEAVQELFAEYGASFYITGGPGDREYGEEVRASILERCGKEAPTVLNFCGETDLVELAALYRRTELLVTVDTGGAHIAATTGVPMVVMYGCTLPDRWHPLSPRARVLTLREPCCPCSVRPEECPDWPRPKCLWGVKPEAVLTECRNLLTGQE